MSGRKVLAFFAQRVSLLQSNKKIIKTPILQGPEKILSVFSYQVQKGTDRRKKVNTGMRHLNSVS